MGKPTRSAGPDPRVHDLLPGRRGETAGWPEAAVDADRQTEPFEHGQTRQDRRHGPPSDGRELVHRGPAEDQLAPDPTGRGTHVGERRGSRSGDPGLREMVGKAEIV